MGREKKLDIIEIAQQESENGQAENSGSEHDSNEEAEESEEGGEDQYSEAD